MKVLHLSTDDNSGGASRSAYRLHQALSEQSVESSMRVLRHDTANARVLSGRTPRTLQKKIVDRIKKQIWEFSIRNWHTENPIMHTFGNTSAGLVTEINQSSSQLVNLHWITDLLSIQDIGEINKPIVWTVHDMWVFCGGEHSTPDTPEARFREGYLSSNRPLTESGPDLNRHAWEKKRAAWANQAITFVAPSRWMGTCIKESALFRNADIDVHVVPNPIDAETVWRPIDKRQARARLGLNPDNHYLLVGSAGGMSSIKGEDMVGSIIQKLTSHTKNAVELIVFGTTSPALTQNLTGKVHLMGRVTNDVVMADLYSAADVMMIPSRQDNLPNTAIEAQACGVPVVGFNIGGVPDIVVHGRGGWVAPSFDLDDFAKGVDWLLENKERYLEVAAFSRNYAVNNFAAKVVADRYIQVYEKVLAGHMPKKAMG